jgi:formamidopyrimidine-DNA glycosylase
MPELPEVETIVKALREGGRDGPPIVGRTLSKSVLLWERSLAEPSGVEFQARIPDQTIIDVGRRGKFIVIHLSQDYLLFHLRMSGDLQARYKQELEEPNNSFGKHDRMVLFFRDGVRLVFNDPRKFGRVWLVKDPMSVFATLGPEPLDPTLDSHLFHQKLKDHKRKLKPLLLDQKFLAGLGNIYTDESLSLAGLHPNISSDHLTLFQADKLLTAIRSVLEEGIRRNGASFDWVYRGGSFQNAFRVYQRTGEPCQVCGKPIERMVIGQRSTHFCPVCQPREN